jgi:hypothetical protein
MSVKKINVKQVNVKQIFEKSRKLLDDEEIEKAFWILIEDENILEYSVKDANSPLEDIFFHPNNFFKDNIIPKLRQKIAHSGDDRNSGIYLYVLFCFFSRLQLDEEFAKQEKEEEKEKEKLTKDKVGASVAVTWYSVDKQNILLCEKAIEKGCLLASSHIAEVYFAELKSKHPNFGTGPDFIGKEGEETMKKIDYYLEAPLKSGNGGTHHAKFVSANWQRYQKKYDVAVKYYEEYEGEMFEGEDCNNSNLCCKISHCYKRLRETKTEAEAKNDGDKIFKFNIEKKFIDTCENIGVKKYNCQHCAENVVNHFMKDSSDNDNSECCEDRIEFISHCFHLHGFWLTEKYCDEYKNDDSDDEEDDEKENNKIYEQSYNASKRRQFLRKLRRFYQTYRPYIHFDEEFRKMMTIISHYSRKSDHRQDRHGESCHQDRHGPCISRENGRVKWAREIIGYLITDYSSLGFSISSTGDDKRSGSGINWQNHLNKKNDVLINEIEKYTNLPKVAAKIICDYLFNLPPSYIC